MPFNSSHWTFIEAVVWIATRDRGCVDALDMVTRSSFMGLLGNPSNKSVSVSALQVRNARAILLDALGASKLGSTGIVMAEAARKEIPADAWANIQLGESRQFNKTFFQHKLAIVTEASIDARLVVGGVDLKVWKDVRIGRSDVLSTWPSDQQDGQAPADISPASSMPENAELSPDQQNEKWHLIFQQWAEKQKAAGYIITQSAAIEAMRKAIGDRAAGLSDRVIIAWTKALPGSWTARPGQKAGISKSADQRGRSAP